MPCEVDANPNQVSFRWTLNNSVDVIEIKNHISSGLRSIVDYAPRKKNHGYGQLFCYATNSIGKQVEPCVFDVIAAGPPNPVVNCLVGNQSQDSIVVKCEPGLDGGLTQNFFLEIYPAGTKELHSNLSSTRWPVFFVQDLPVSTAFRLVLYASNAKGKSQIVSLSASTTPFRSDGK